MAATQGLLLFVTMQQSKDGIELNDFNDWYHNERGPTRLRFLFTQNGYRYCDIDLDDLGKGQSK